MWASSFGALLLLVTADACDRLDSLACSERRGARPLPAAAPLRAGYPLPALSLQLDLPGDATVQEMGGRVVIIIGPGRRTPLSIELQRAQGADAFAGPELKRRSLTPQLQLSYREQVESGGSGGDDATLDGELTVGSDRYRVTCRQQSELAASARNCLPVLATLRAMSR